MVFQSLLCEDVGPSNPGPQKQIRGLAYLAQRVSVTGLPFRNSN